MSDRDRMRSLARALGEVEGVTVPTKRVQKARRDYTARELRAMADDALKGIPPAGSPAQHEIRRATIDGDFERANALTAEVKEKAPALARLARAAEKAERRAKRGRHIHICKDFPHPCGPEGMGPCSCDCGAVLELNRREGMHAWHLSDGTWAPFPDPREAEHPKARRLARG